MDVDTLMMFIKEYGYWALFFFLWLGIVGMPIPDEVIVMTGGLVASLNLLKPVPAFFVTYLGVVSGLTIGYLLGRIIGAPVLDYLVAKKNMGKYLKKSYDLIDRYGSYALCISYGFPIVRHVVPYIVGISKMPFRRYALISYTTGFFWTLIFFVIGYFFGLNIEEIGKTVYSYGIYALIILLPVSLVVWYIVQSRRNQQQKQSGSVTELEDSVS
ncbi:MAG: DedA family protein [Clostridia bacterium]|nr:DedA family protein [Clostridia bacterium]